MSRWKAAGLHLFICVAIALVALAVMLLVWYPWPLFQAMGGNELVMILVAVDVVIGPLCTLVVFKSGKWGMKFDLMVIGLLQAAAFAYGAYVVSLARPAYIVFVKDRYEVATPVELEPEALAQARFPEFRGVPLWKPRLVATDFPTDKAEQQHLINQALAGLDLQHFPKYYAPYAERRDLVLSKAQTLAEFRQSEPKGARVIEDWLRESGRPEDSVRCLLLRARKAFVAVAVDPKTAEPVKMLISEKI